MKGIIYLLCSTLIMFASASFAASKTSLDQNWICTTNASSSAVAEEQAADKQMKETAKSAADAFAFASSNCRDCSKITCKIKK